MESSCLFSLSKRAHQEYDKDFRVSGALEVVSSRQWLPQPAIPTEYVGLTGSKWWCMCSAGAWSRGCSAEAYLWVVFVYRLIPSCGVLDSVSSSFSSVLTSSFHLFCDFLLKWVLFLVPLEYRACWSIPLCILTCSFGAFPFANPVSSSFSFFTISEGEDNFTSTSGLSFVFLLAKLYGSSLDASNCVFLPGEFYILDPLLWCQPAEFSADKLVSLCHQIKRELS